MVRLTREAHLARRKVAWTAAQRRGEFSYKQLSGDTSLSIDDQIRKFVGEWIVEGLVEVAEERRNGQKRFRLTELGRKRGMPSAIAAAAAETAHGNMWRAMRGLANFTALDISTHATTPTCAVEERQAQEYCQMLVRAGYLKVVQKAVPGRRHAIYRLIKQTGPRPPRERRVRAVYDDNLGEYVHIARGLS